jgi:hypothetical protein
LDSINLNQIAPNRGVATTNYFTGRTLAAEDLRTDQLARQLQLGQLGRAVGAGVAYGLQVTGPVTGAGGGSNNVNVAAGLAVNRRGRPLTLPSDVQVALTVSSPTAPTGAGLFADCQPPQSSPTVVSDGLYILTITPASSFDGTVPAVDLSGADPTLSGCGSRNLIEGVRFRLVALNLDQLPGVSSATVQAIKTLAAQSDAASLSLLRNRVAHMFFGTDSWITWGNGYEQAWTGDSTDEPFGLLAALRAAKLLVDCDVPLALIYWTGSGVSFIDRWSVRRSLEPIGRGLGFPLAAGSARSLARAVFCQFQEQVDWLYDQLASNPSLASSNLATLFAYLPPMGVVPVSGANSAGGFSLPSFFGGKGPVNPTVIRLSHLASLLQKAEAVPPAPVATTQVLQVYSISENLQAASTAQTDQVFAAFTTRDLQGFVENDDVVVTLTQAWENYARVVRTMAILPTVVATGSLPAWTAIFSVLQNLVQFTLAKATAAQAGDLDLNSVFRTFRDLFTLENTLAQVMQLTFTGDVGVATRQQRSSDLSKLLQGTLNDGSPGLGTSLQTFNYPGVIRAQKAVNDLVKSWGAFSTIGGVTATFVGSDKGLTVVSGQATNLSFNLNSQLLDRATILLSASVVASRAGDWSNACAVLSANNQPLSSVDIDPQQTIPFVVRVTAPGGLIDFGDTVRVEVVASLPTQSVQSAPTDVDLTLTAVAGPPQDYTLVVGRIPSTLPPTSTGVPNQASPFNFQSTYTATRPPTSILCTFTATFTFQATQRSDWQIVIAGQPAAEVGSTGVFTYKFTLPPSAINQNVLTQIRITPQFNPDPTLAKSCSFTVAVAGTVFDPQNNTNVALSGSAPGGPFGVVVPHA